MAGYGKIYIEEVRNIDNKIRLRDIWPLLPGNHAVSLRVKKPDRHVYYHVRRTGYADAGCPYERQYAEVISVYSVAPEIIEITIKENKFVKE